MKLLLILALAVIAVVAFALPDQRHHHHRNGTIGDWAGRWNGTAVGGQQFNRTDFAGGRRRPGFRPPSSFPVRNRSRPIFLSSANITDDLF